VACGRMRESLSCPCIAGPMTQLGVAYTRSPTQAFELAALVMARLQRVDAGSRALSICTIMTLRGTARHRSIRPVLPGVTGAAVVTTTYEVVHNETQNVLPVHTCEPVSEQPRGGQASGVEGGGTGSEGTSSFHAAGSPELQWLASPSGSFRRFPHGSRRLRR